LLTFLLFIALSCYKCSSKKRVHKKEKFGLLYFVEFSRLNDTSFLMGYNENYAEIRKSKKPNISKCYKY
jgi:CRISPR/Cas system CMR-associated protein Cmr3 (group 5 of RAMP superfamily)